MISVLSTLLAFCFALKASASFCQSPPFEIRSTLSTSTSLKFLHELPFDLKINLYVETSNQRTTMKKVPIFISEEENAIFFTNPSEFAAIFPQEAEFKRLNFQLILNGKETKFEIDPEAFQSSFREFVYQNSRTTSNLSVILQIVLFTIIPIFWIVLYFKVFKRFFKFNLLDRCLSANNLIK